jgi:hypothetical protein
LPASAVVEYPDDGNFHEISSKKHKIPLFFQSTTFGKCYIVTFAEGGTLKTDGGVAQ